MTHLFPVMLDLAGLPCLLVGGGRMAEEKIGALVESGAAVTIQAAELSDRLRDFVDAGQAEWRRSVYQAGDLAGFRLVIAADEDRTRNQAMFAEAERTGVLFNALDDPPNCRFVFPSVHRQGDLVLAASTSGKCPALAVRIRQRWEQEFGPGYGEFLRTVGRMRERLAGLFPEFGERKRVWYRLVDSEALERFERGDAEAARQALEGVVESAVEEQKCLT